MGYPADMIPVTIRPAADADAPALRALYTEAFPTEDLLPLLRDLMADRMSVTALAATIDGALVGHAGFTLCTIEGSEDVVALLAPLAVAPRVQRRGVGRVLVAEGARLMAGRGVRQLQVLGDPAYYGRLGFSPESAVLAPYRLPSEWLAGWQRLSLDGRGSAPAGRLVVPPFWRRPELWGP